MFLLYPLAILAGGYLGKLRDLSPLEPLLIEINSLGGVFWLITNIFRVKLRASFHREATHQLPFRRRAKCSGTFLTNFSFATTFYNISIIFNIFSSRLIS